MSEVHIHYLLMVGLFHGIR